MPGTAGTVACVLLAGPLLAVGVLAGAAATASPPVSAGDCGGAGTAQTVGAVHLDAEQMGNAQTIVATTAARRLPVYAAVVAVATAYTESKLINSSVQTDHDSEGLFQQRVRYYTKTVADDPVRSTNAFLDRLTALPGWQTTPLGVDAQHVQKSQYPSRYQPNAALAAQVVGRLWPTASATAATGPSAGPAAAAPAVCAGAGGAAGSIVGPHGNNVAGTTVLPAGLVITGTTKGQQAVRYAIAQLGKPYVWAGAGPDVFDCSGLTMAAWATAGIALPHQAALQVGHGTPEPTTLSQAVGGDLVFIPGADGTPARPGHVGMVAGYVDGTDGRHLWLVQAPMTGIPVEMTEATEWSGQVSDVRHIG